MRKKINTIISFLLILTFVITGCGQNAGDAEKVNADIADSPQESANSQAPELEEDANLSKAQWAWMISEQFGYSEGEEEHEAFYSDVEPSDNYYNEIQLCKAFEVFTEEGTFEPDTLVSWNYALESAVRAIGIEKLKVSESGLVSYYMQNIADIASDDMDSAITVADATVILDYAYDYNAAVEIPQEYSVQYNESVYEVSVADVMIKGDGETAVINTNGTYNVGDTLCAVEEDGGAAFAIKLTEINGTEVKYVPAGFTNVYKEFRVSGTYAPADIDVEGAPDITVSLISDTSNPWEACSLRTNPSGRWDVQKAGLKASKSGIAYDYNDGGLSFHAALSNFKTTVDIDFPKKVETQVSFDTSVDVNYRNDEYKAKTIPLGDAKIGVCPGVYVKLSLYINIGVSGEVTLDYSSKVITDVGYKKNAGLRSSVNSKGAQCTFEAQCTVTAEPTAKVDLRLGSKTWESFSESAVNAKMSTGLIAVAETKADLLGKEQLVCVDILAFVPLKWAINEDGCLMTGISSKLKASGDVWNSENSPCRWHFHWENGSLVEACTRDKDKVETPPVDEDGKPYDEYKLFDFEEIDFGVITVASQTIYLKNGESMKIGITSVPDGYSADKLVYSPDNASVCSVSGGRVTALSSGASTVKISTDDGKYSVFITVVVEAEYNDTSGFRPL